MPKIARPKVLPKVTYNPGRGDPDRRPDRSYPPQSNTNPYGPTLPMLPPPNIPSQGPAYGPLASGYVVNPNFSAQQNAGGGMNYDYDTSDSITGDARPLPNAPPPTSPTDSRQEDVSGHREAVAQQRAQDAAGKNQRLTQEAAAAGDTQELARLKAEWERLSNSSIFQNMYGSQLGNPEGQLALQQRLVNVYMKPDDPNAATDLQGAGEQMIADDIWAQAFQMATGRAPNEVEWTDHNVGRDPLTGHPEAIQWMQQKADELRKQNQVGAYATYQQLLDANGNVMS